MDLKLLLIFTLIVESKVQNRSLLRLLRGYRHRHSLPDWLSGCDSRRCFCRQPRCHSGTILLFDPSLQCAQRGFCFWPKSRKRTVQQRRVNVMLALFIIGLLPSGRWSLQPIVDNAGGIYQLEDKTLITSYFRHISEAFLPTYASIILACAVRRRHDGFRSCYAANGWRLFLLGYFGYVRKIRETGLLDLEEKKRRKNLAAVSGRLPTIALSSF